MKFLKNSFLGKLNYFLARFFEILFEIIVGVTNFIVGIIDGVKGIFVGLGSLLLLFMFFNPFFLFNPWVLIIIFVLFIVPILGKGLVNYLKYLEYMVCEYFYDKSDYYLKGRTRSFSNMGEYGRKYVKQENERKYREQQERQRAQQQEWEDRFKQWYDYQQRAQQGYGGYTGGQAGGGTFFDPTDSFLEKYKASCATLEIPVTTDKYEIKLAYRKMAKKYHPDINKDPGATEQFQKINEAYEFLNDGNVQRYEQMTKN